VTEEIEEVEELEEFEDDNLREDIDVNKDSAARELERRSIEEDDIKSHYLLDKALVGAIEERSEGYAKIYFIPTQEMVADKRGMIHAGFIFSSANYAAMVAINLPTAVLAVSKVNFLSPLKIGEHAVFEAFSPHKDLRKQNVRVVGYLHGIKFFEGEFVVIILEHHPLSLKLLKN